MERPSSSERLQGLSRVSPFSDRTERLRRNGLAATSFALLVGGLGGVAKVPLLGIAIPEEQMFVGQGALALLAVYFAASFVLSAVPEWAFWATALSSDLDQLLEDAVEHTTADPAEVRRLLRWSPRNIRWLFSRATNPRDLLVRDLARKYYHENEELLASGHATVRMARMRTSLARARLAVAWAHLHHSLLGFVAPLLAAGYLALGYWQDAYRVLALVLW